MTNKTATPKTAALAKPDMEVLMLPPNVELLEDNSQYTSRFDFAAASGNVYRVAQSKKGRWWACSCPAWINKVGGERHCKHLRDFGLPPEYQAFEVGRLELAPADSTPVTIGAVPMPVSKKGKAALTAVQGGKAPPALLPAPAPAPGCKPTSVEMKDGEIIVKFDDKDSAAVFALLSTLSGGNG